MVSWTTTASILLISSALLITGSEGACNCKPGQKCILDNCVLDISCRPERYGRGPPTSCAEPTDPQNRTKSNLESWFTAEIFNDLFPKANLGWGPNKCSPYNYEAFAIAARYFPKFGTDSPDNGFTPEENYRRDLATFFSHAIQETGENMENLYRTSRNQEAADACFYRGGFFNWFEGGPQSAILPNRNGQDPQNGELCINTDYCNGDKRYPCNMEKVGNAYKGCYFGRGAIQISYNYNYGQFQQWLKEQKIDVDLLKNPNLVITKTDPPLAIMASMWFYMTPQWPIPAMHDVVMGNWKAKDVDIAAGYKGPMFGPTSLIINNECGGEEKAVPGTGGENRRIKAYKWFSQYFNFRLENETFLSCHDMTFDGSPMKYFYQPNISTKPQPNSNSSNGNNGTQPGTNNFQQNQPFVCSGPGSFPNPSNCNAYIECVNGQPINRDCGKTLHFNPTIKICDWPQNAGCQQKRNG